jgi:hypothetical protein
MQDVTTGNATMGSHLPGQIPGSTRPEGRRARLLAILTAALTLTVLAALFFGYFAVQAWRYPFRRSDVRVEGDWSFAADPEIGFVAAKNATTLRRHLKAGLAYHLHTDARGARVNAPGEQSLSHVDLMTIGCSFGWGHGIENPDTFTERLKRRLGVSGANFALASYSGLNALQILERNLDMRPRVVLYGFIDDHLQRNVSPCAGSYAPYCTPVAYVSFDAGRPYVHPPHMEYFSQDLNREYYRQVLSADPGLTLADVLWRMRVDLFRYPDARRLRPPRDDRLRAEALDYVIARMLAATKAVGARLVVFYIPRGRAAKGPPSALREAVAGRDLTFVDLAPRFREWYADPTRPRLDIPVDGHPNATAHALIAEELETVVAPLLSPP